MRLNSKCWPRLTRTARPVLAAGLILLMLAMVVLASCPALHHVLHADSDQPGHGCVVTLFAKGQLGGAETAPMFVFVALFLFCAYRLPRSLPRPAFEYGSAPSRAPPAR